MSDDQKNDDKYKVTVLRAPPALYVPVGVSGHSLSWRLHSGPAGNEEMPDEAFVQRLACAYVISADELTQLFKQIEKILFEDVMVLDVEGLPDRLEKGRRQAAAASKLVKKSNKILRQVRDIVTNIHFDELVATSFPQPKKAEPIEIVRSAVDQTAALEEVLLEACSKNRVVYERNPDRRRNRDPRRTHVCNAIFCFWREQERPLSYTTNPVSNEREGPLIRFVNEVIEQITEPPTRLKGETIVSELENFRKTT